jgi:superfamily II DNA/RNA helicase
MRQFIGRTARIGNKGTYSMVVLDKNQKNSEPEVFFKKKIEELKNNDVIGLSKMDIKKQQYTEEESSDN